MRSTRLQGRERRPSRSNTSESEGSIGAERGHRPSPNVNVFSEDGTTAPGPVSSFGQGRGHSFQLTISPTIQAHSSIRSPSWPEHPPQQLHPGQNINRAVGFRFGPSRPLGPPPGWNQQRQPQPPLGLRPQPDILTQGNIGSGEPSSNINQNPGFSPMDYQFGSQPWNRNVNQNQTRSSYSHGFGDRMRQRSEPSLFGGSSSEQCDNNFGVYNAFRDPPWNTAATNNNYSSAPASREHRTEDPIEFASQSYADTVAGRRRQSGGDQTGLTGVVPPSLIPGQSVQLLSTLNSGPAALYNREYDPKQMLGELLFPMVKEMYPDLAGKLTGMLLEMDDAEILKVLKDKKLLDSHLKDAYEVLTDALRAKNTGVGSSLGNLNIGRKP